MAKSFVYGFVPYNVTIRYTRFIKLVQCVTLMPLFSFFCLEVGLSILKTHISCDLVFGYYRVLFLYLGIKIPCSAASDFTNNSDNGLELSSPSIHSLEIQIYKKK